MPSSLDQEDSDFLKANSSVRAVAEKFLANRHNAKTVANPDSYTPKSDPIWGNETIVLSKKSNDYKNAVKKDVITFVSVSVTNVIGVIGGILSKNKWTKSPSEVSPKLYLAGLTTMWITSILI
ncbi:hypothetical protein ACI48J_03760 [Paenibacillus chitinolyticus]|uniref:hypothetical protein n=1 Tax=Paenibacillus chitinolyticus TaxID=79263 RepID=UPI00386E5FD1